MTYEAIKNELREFVKERIVYWHNYIQLNDAGYFSILQGRRRRRSGVYADWW